MALKTRQKFAQKYPVYELDLFPIKSSTDIHPHTDWTDGMLSLVESVDEAYQYGLWEKGAIEHGNPLDLDIDHPTTFLKDSDEFEDEDYTSEESYLRKFESLREIAEDIPGASTISDASPDKLAEDLETMEMLEKAENNYESDHALNYSIILPHGVELDYNPVTETASNEKEHSEAVETYEKGLIDFLKEAESKNAGYNYVLLSSHYVNTPFQPRYVKKDKLFQQMSHEEKGEILEHYRDKEITKIQSLAAKLSEMSIPEASDELMDSSEREELTQFIYDQSQTVENMLEEEISGEQLQEVIQPSLEISIPEFSDESSDSNERRELQQFIYDQSEMIENISGAEISSKQFEEATKPSLEISMPGPLAVGAHPTIIERNHELMDYFREEEGIKTKAEIDEDQQMNEGELYPSKTLEEYYKPVVEAAEQEENFIFEINGKGIERQYPSVFWEMLDENLFGTDSHRSGEQPSRTEEFKDHDLESETKFLTEKWLSQLNKHNSEEVFP